MSLVLRPISCDFLGSTNKLVEIIYYLKQRKKWKYYDGDTTCVCGLATENTAHLLQCSLLTRPCTLDDLLEFNDTGRECAERWKKTV